MNYWLLTTEYPPSHGGGISTYCRFTVQMLAEAGYTVTVFTQDDSMTDYTITLESPAIRIIRFNSNRNNLHSFLGYASRLAYNFADVVRMMIETESKPDFIEAQDYMGIAYYLIQFKHTGYDFLSNVPIIVTLHSPAFIYLSYNRVPIYRFPDFWTGEMEKQTIIAADALISPTHFLVEEIEKHISLSGREIGFIANPYRNDANLNPILKRNKIVYYGKLSPQKGSFELLEYFKEMWDKGFPHALHIVGSTDIVYHPEMQTMGQLVKKKYAFYIEKKLLKLHGKIKPAQIHGYLQDAHVIIVPSIVDNLPYVVMEAMSAGKVVLASIQGGQKEMIEEGITGYLFDHADPATFGMQLNKILSLSDDRLQQIGSKACETVKDKYSFENISSQKNNFLQKIKNNLPAHYFPFLYQEEIKPVPDSKPTRDLLTVVIPYFNMGGYIEECVHSILSSTYKNIELLIINDGSTDSASIAKLHSFATFKNITIIDRPNQGLASVRNYGAGAARGEFLAFLDADDKVDPAYYEKALHALAQNGNVYFAGSWVRYFENSKAIWPSFTPQPPYALVHNPINSSGLVYKRAAFLKGGLNDKKVDYGMEDYESVVNMLHHGFNGVVLPEVLFYYRVRSGSMFRDITTQKLMYSNSYILKKHTEYYTKFAPQIINLLNANGPGYLFDNPTFEINVNTSANNKSLLFLKLKKFIKRNPWLKTMALAAKKIKP